MLENLKDELSQIATSKVVKVMFVKMLSRLPGNVSSRDVDFVKCKQLYSYGTKTILVAEISPVSKRGLRSGVTFSSHM